MINQDRKGKSPAWGAEKGRGASSPEYEHFLLTWVQPALIDMKQTLESYIKENYDFMKQQFKESFQMICLEAARQQEKGEKRGIAYIHYDILKTSVLQKKNTISLKAYDEDWYLDQNPCETVFACEWFFQALYRFEAEIKIRSQQYIGKVNGHHIMALKHMALSLYQPYLVLCCRQAVKEAMSSPEYRKMKRHSKFDVRVGEFRDISESVCFVDETLYQDQEIRCRLSQKGEVVNAYGYFSGHQLEAGDFHKNQLNWTLFKACHFDESSFSASMMIGTQFENCSLKNCSFDQAVIWNADFAGCDLTGAKLRAVNRSAAVSPKASEFPLFSRINFQNAKLSLAQFNDSNLTGADFRGAILTDCNLNGCILDCALLPQEYRQDGRLQLSGQQWQGIVWV